MNSGARSHNFRFLLQYRPVVVGVLAACLAAIEVFIDWDTWIQLNVSIVYSLPLVIAAAARSRWLIWVLTLFLVSATFVVYMVQIPRGVFSLHEPFFVNRVLAAVTVVLAAALLHVLTLAVDTLAAQRRSLAEQNVKLETVNVELLQSKEEIARQNEELEIRRREAEAASGRKTRMLASVSHDIRTPLNTISLMAEVIRRTAGSPAAATQVPGLAQRLHANALSLADLVSDVLDIASIDSGRLALRESEFRLDELVREACQHLLPLAHAKRLRLTTEVPAQPIRLRTDRVKLSRVLGNLISNAIKFTDSGDITVGAALTPDGGLLIAVRDTGVGIAPDNRERIFDEYAQLQSAERGSATGWGLGLAICRRLVDLMGGQIAVESELGRGSVFTVYLPASCVVEPSLPDSAGSGTTRSETA